MRTIAVGDLHGQAEKLLDILDKTGYTIEDRLVVLGDLSDARGKAVETSQFLRLIDILEGIPNKVLIKGNHDDFLVRFLDNLVSDEEFKEWFIHNGFQPTFNEINPILKDKEAFQRLRLFYDQFVSYFETDKFVFTHAGFNPYFGFYKSSDEDRMWSRTIVLSAARRNGDPLRNGKTLVVGHTPTVEFMSLAVPFIGPHVICLDTGAGYGLPLTAMDMDNLTWQQSILGVRDEL